MATLAFAAVGAGAGAAIGGSFLGLSSTSIGWTIGGLIGNALFGEKAAELPAAFGPRLTDLKIQTSTYGNMIPRAFGIIRIAGNVIWAPNIEEHAETTTVSTGGGKGGGGGGTTQQVTNYSYTADFAVAICEGEIIGIRKVWENGRLIYDVGVDSPLLSVLGSAPGMRIYTGSETQTTDPTIAAALGAGNTPAYRGTAYVVFDQRPVQSKNLAQYEFEVVASGSIEQLVPHDYFDAEDDFPGSSVPVDNMLQVGSGSSSFWQLSGYDGSHFKSVSLYNTYTQSKGLEVFPDSGGTEIRLIGIGADNRVWVETRPDGFASIDQAGLVTQYDQFVALDALRIIQLYEPPSLAVDKVVFIEYNSATPFVKQLFKILVDDFVGETDVIQQQLIFPGTRSLAWFLQKANRILGRVYCGAHHTDVAVLGYVETGRNDSVTVTVIRTYDTANDFAGFVGLDGYIYVRSVNTGAGNVIEKLSQDGTVIDSCTLPGISSTNYSSGTTRFAQDDHEFLYVQVDNGTDKGIFRIRYATMDVDASSVFVHDSERISPASTFEGQAVVAVRVDAAPNTMVRMIANDRVITDPPLLSDVVTTLCELSGLSSPELDVSQLTEKTVSGYVISQRNTARSAIEQLMAAYFFDAVESDDKIKFVLRGGEQATVIPEDDLAAHTGDIAELPPQLSIVRKQEMELPVEVSLKYFNREFDYQISQQRSRRLITQAKQSVSIDLPIVLTDDEALLVADVSMFVTWANRQAHEFQTSRKYIKYEPTDLLGVTKAGVIHNIRVTQKSEGADGVIHWQGLTEEVSVYTQSGVGAGVGVAPAETKIIGPTQAVYMDIPLLRDEDDDAGFYIATRGQAAGWHGNKLFISRDDGATYSEVSNGLTLAAATTGRAITALQDYTEAGHEKVDLGSYVDVVMLSGTVESITEAQFLDYGNPAMIGSEIIRFRDAELIDTDTYRLSYLLRGCLGTELEMTGHVAGENFVLLNEDIRSIGRPISEVNTVSLYKPASIGRTLQQTAPDAFINTAVKKLPLSVINVGGGKNSSGDWLLHWTRRTRYRAAWADGADAPLGEEVERYEIDILSGSTVVATLYASTNSYTYTAAQQVIDSGSTHSGLRGTIYQVSGEYGRGPGRDFYFGNLIPSYYWAIANGTTGGGGYFHSGEIEIYDDTGALLLLSGSGDESGMAGAYQARFTHPTLGAAHAGRMYSDNAGFGGNHLYNSFDTDLSVNQFFWSEGSASTLRATWFIKWDFSAIAKVKLVQFRSARYDTALRQLAGFSLYRSDTGNGDPASSPGDWILIGSKSGIADAAANFTFCAMQSFD